MDIAVGEGQRPDPLRNSGGNQLGDGAATIVADEIDRVDPEGVEEFEDLSPPMGSPGPVSMSLPPRRGSPRAPSTTTFMTRPSSSRRRL